MCVAEMAHNARNVCSKNILGRKVSYLLSNIYLHFLTPEKQILKQGQKNKNINDMHNLVKMLQDIIAEGKY